ncbi:helix-turn-helix domain-containing protein [Streptomyces sp. NPDC056549]|uniref:helix-turn-helix domain-containing protein n=1 Tax=Streptomyces sp. NPDC056549 TaxID=3345864 RepID=UPI00368FA69E
MIDVRNLSARPELGLSCPVEKFGERDVRCVQLLSGTDWMEADIENALIVTAIGFIGDYHRLLETLATRRAAGLVITGAPEAGELHPIQQAADRCRIPVLTSTRTLRQWKSALAAQVDQLSIAAGRLHARRLADLLNQLRSPGPDFIDAVTSLVSRELSADVVVSVNGQIRTAMPPTAAINLSSVLRTPFRGQRTTPAGAFARVEPISSLPDAYLAIAFQNPPTRAERELVSHAANVLALALAPARNGDEDKSQAIVRINLAVFQLLMTGHVVDAQRVMASVSPGLLDTEEARVFVIECEENRDAVMAAAEKEFAGTALPIRCPAYPQHIITVMPEHPDRDPELAVRQILSTFQKVGVTAGGSLSHPLERIAGAYVEALDALQRANHRAERMIVNASRAPGLADILPASMARAWASRVLEPILTSPDAHEVLKSLTLALEFKTGSAARIINIHRNTVHRRVTKAFESMGYQPDRALDRIAVSLALQAIDAHGPSTNHDHIDVSLHDLLLSQPVRAWAEKFLRPLAADERHLRTLRAWVHNEFDVGATAAQLLVAPRTVRSWIKDTEPLVEKDLITIWPLSDEDQGEQRLSGIRPLTVALYATTPLHGPYPALPDFP